MLKAYNKIACLVFYYLGDIFCRLDYFELYDYCMSKSIDIDLKNNLNIWKEKHEN